MPVYLRPNELYVKNPNGSGYLPQNVISETSTAEMLAAFDETIANTQESLDAMTAEAQTAVNGIESLKNDMIASIASVAGQGTDTTLTQSGVAADAKTVGNLKILTDNSIKQISDSKIPVYLTWEKGNIDSSGADSSSNTLMRSVGYTEVHEGAMYTMHAINGNGMIARLYSDQSVSSFLGSISAAATDQEVTNNVVFTNNYPTAKYVRFVINRRSSEYTINNTNVDVCRTDERFDDFTVRSGINREYQSRWAYGYMGLTYHSGDGTGETDRQLLMYLSPNGMDWYKIKSLNAPIRGWDYSTVYKNGVFYITFDYKDMDYGTWIDTDTGANGAENYNRGSNRIGIMRTSDFVNWTTTLVDLTHTTTINGQTVTLNSEDIISTWGPEWYLEGDDFYIVYAQAETRTTAATGSGAIRYLKNQIAIVKINSSFDGITSYKDITPAIENPFVIDPSLIKKSNTYYLQFKNENTGICTIFKADANSVPNLSNAWTSVHEFVGKSEGMTIIYDSRIQRYLAYSDLRFTNRDESDVLIGKQQYAVAISKDMENWSEMVAINVQGDAPLRHFTPLILTQYSGARVKTYIDRYGNLDSMVDETKAGKCYDLIAEISGEETWDNLGTACNHYTNFLMQTGAVYRVANGSIQVDDIDLSFMRPGDMCTFVIVDANSSITFASGKLKTGQAVTLSGLDSIMIVVCTNSLQNTKNGRKNRAGTEARALIQNN